MILELNNNNIVSKDNSEEIAKQQRRDSEWVSAAYKLTITLMLYNSSCCKENVSVISSLRTSSEVSRCIVRLGALKGVDLPTDPPNR